MHPSFELLNAEKILNVIDSDNHSRLAKLEIFDTIDSTNQYLLNHAKTGPVGWICLAEKQTAGRGRRGRSWFSEHGSSILCSILWRFSQELFDISGLSIAVGVMVMQALKKFGVRSGIQLKWPNDILFADRKLAGILLERRGENIVIGLGLNVNLSKRMDAAYIDLAEIIGQFITERNYLAGLILNELLKGLQAYQTQGLITFMDAWQQHDFLAGKEVSVYLPEKIIRGKAQGINERGELLVLDEMQAVQHFCYGEVSVR